MRTRAVLFDLWGTLAHPFPGPECEEALVAMAWAVGVPYEIFSPRWSHETWRQRATGFFPTIEANVQYICQQSGICPSPQQLAEAVKIRHAFTRRALRPRVEAARTLHYLKEMGLRLGLLSDCSAETPEIWLETPLACLIDVSIFSCRTGTKKPDPVLYRLACANLGVALSECVYVADGYSRELEAASTLEMCAVLMAPPDETPADTNDWEGKAWTGLLVTNLLEVCDLQRVLV